MDDIELLQLASQAELLATVDDVDYLSVSVVLSRPSGHGAPALFCAASDWPQSLPARLAEKEREIAELATVNAAQAAKVLELSQRLAALEARLRDAPPPRQTPQQTGGAEKRVTCPSCGAKIWPTLLDAHMAEKHPPAPAAPIVLATNDQGWRCAVKGCSGAFARSVLEPDFCTYHAKPVHQNGVETPVA